MTIEQYTPELKKIRGLLVGSSKGHTVTEISRKMGINRNSVAKYLDVLLTSGVVEMKVVGSAKLFTISKRMPLHSIMNISSDYILVLDEDSRVSYANENMLRLEKKTHENITGILSDELDLIRHATPDIRKCIADSLAGGEVVFEFEIQTDPSPGFFRAKFVPGILENQKKGIIIILNNITDVRQKQEYSVHAGQVSNGRVISGSEAGPGSDRNSIDYQRYLELAREGIWAVDENFRTTFANAWVAGILGYTVQEIIGKSLHEFISTHEKDRIKKYMQRLHDKRSVPATFEFEFIRKDGSHIVTSIRFSPFISENGRFRGALATISDITSQKKSEERLRVSEHYYRTIIETSPSGFLIFDASGHIAIANRQIAKYLGFSSTVNLDGKNLFDFISPNDVGKCQQLFGKIRDEKTIGTISCTLIKNDSTDFCADLTVSPVEEASDNREYLIGIITDVTEHRRAVSEIKRSELKYRSLVEGISHIVFTTDLNGKITYISPVIQEILGYASSELINKHFYAIIASDHRHALGVQLKEAQHGKTSPSDFQMMDKSGNLHEVRIIAKPLKNEGKLMGVTGLIGAINDWEQTVNPPIQGELKYTAAAGDRPDLICRFSTDYLLRFANPAFEDFFAVSEPDLQKMSVFDFFPVRFHENLKSVLDRMNTEIPVYTFETVMESPSGISSTYHVTFRALFSPQGEKKEYQMGCRDITKVTIPNSRSSQQLLEQQEQQVLISQNEELRRALLEAKSSEKQYRDLYETMPVGSVSLDPNGRILELNETASQILGRPKKHLEGQEFAHLVSRESLGTFLNFFHAIFRTQHNQNCEIRIEGSHEAPVILDIKGLMGEQQVTHHPEIRLIFTEITQKKLSEERIRYLASFPDMSPNQILEFDLAGKPVFYNSATVNALKAWGTDENPYLFLPADFSDMLVDLAKGVKRQYLREIVVSGHVVCETLETLPQTRTIRIYAMDITDRKQEEIAQRNLLDDYQCICNNMPAMIWYKDTENTILRVNPAAAHLFGKSADEIEGKNIVEVFPELAEQFSRDDRDIILSKKPVRGIVELIRTSSGETRWIRTDKVPIVGNEGRVNKLLVFSTDISEGYQNSPFREPEFPDACLKYQQIPPTT